MELVQGVPITEFCDKNHLSTTERIKLFIPVCQAVQHAHQKRVVHRDLKPSNVLVTLNDGVAHPMVIDFGVAKALNQKLTEKTLFTQFATMIGTPAYMSPEQAEMSKLDVDTRSDIYSLGVLLYELLTGSTPFPEARLRSVGYGEMQRIIAQEEPERPSTRLTKQRLAKLSGKANSQLRTPNSEIDADLDWIVMKCIEKDRARRYETATGLAADIQRFLKGEPIVARPPSTAYRLQKAIRRNKLAFAAGAAVTAALVVGLGLSTFSFFRERAARDEAVTRRTEAERARLAETAARSQAERHLYATDMILAQQSLADNNLGHAAKYVLKYTPARSPSIPDSSSAVSGQTSNDPRGWEWRFLARQLQGSQLRVATNGGLLAQARYSPDGSLIVLSERWSGQLSVRETHSTREIARRPTQAGFGPSFAFRPDGQVLAVPDSTNVLFLAPRTLLSVAAPRSFPSWVIQAAYSPDGRLLAILHNEEVLLLSADSLEIQNRHRIESSWTLAFSPDGSRLAIATMSKAVLIWNLRNEMIERRLAPARENPHYDFVLGEVTFSPDGRYLAATFWDRQGVSLWETANWKPIPDLGRIPALCGEVEFSRDGSALFVARTDQVIERFETVTWQSRGLLRGHRDEVWSLAIAPDGKTLASSSKDGTARFWSLDDSTPAEAGAEMPTDTWACRLSADGRTALTLHTGDRFLLWDALTQTRVAEGTLPANHFYHTMQPIHTPVAVSSNRRWIALGTWDGHVLVSDLAKSNLSWRAVVRDDRVRGVFFSRDDSILAVLTGEGVVQLRESETGRLQSELKVMHSVTQAAFGPDPTRLAVVSFGREEIYYWNSSQSTNLVALKSAGHRPQLGTISPDGHWLATAGNDSVVYLWELPSGRLGHKLSGQLNSFNTISWSPDGRRLAAGGTDASVFIWDAESGQEVLRLKNPGEDKARYGVHDLRFLDDGDTLVGINSEVLWTWKAIPKGGEFNSSPNSSAPNP